MGRNSYFIVSTSLFCRFLEEICKINDFTNYIRHVTSQWAVENSSVFVLFMPFSHFCCLSIENNRMNYFSNTHLFLFFLLLLLWYQKQTLLLYCISSNSSEINSEKKTFFHLRLSLSRYLLLCFNVKWNFDWSSCSWLHVINGHWSSVRQISGTWPKMMIWLIFEVEQHPSMVL